MIPEQADGDLQQVLALRRFVQAVSYTLGPAVGAIAVSVVGARGALLLPCVTFAAAIALLVPVHGLDRGAPERRRAATGQGLAGRFGSMVAGLAVLTSTATLRRLMAYWSLAMAAVAIVMGAAVIWFEESLGVAGAWYGLSIAAYGIGSTVGLAWAGGRRFHHSLAVILLISAPIYAACSLLGVVAEVPWLLPLGWFGWGVAMGPEMVIGEVLVVESVPEAARGRAFAAMGVLLMLGLAAGYGVAGPLIEGFGPRMTIVGASFGLLALGLLWIGPALRPRTPVFATAPHSECRDVAAVGPVGDLIARSSPGGRR